MMSRDREHAEQGGSGARGTRRRAERGGTGRRARRLGLLAALLPAGMWLAGAPGASTRAWAAPTGVSITVATCAASDLVAAIAQANTTAGGVINLAAGCTYTLEGPDNHVDGPNGLPDITGAVTILGNGATIARDPSQAPFRLFHVSSSGVLSLQSLTLANGAAHGGNGAQNGGGGGAGLGGAIFSYGGSVTLADTTFGGNQAAGGAGGYNANDNFAGGGGGGLDGNGGYDSHNGGAGGGPNGGCGGGSPSGTGCNGGFGGGGGGGGDSGGAGGAGGFGGGGGGASDDGGSGGAGGFGGGGGASRYTQAPGSGGSFGGAAATTINAPGGGGGGAGLGGAIFAYGGSLALQGASFANNSAAGGAGGNAALGGGTGQAGKGKGGAVFADGTTSVTVSGQLSFSGNTASDAGGTATDNNNVYGTLSVPAAVTLGNLSQTYDGTARAASASVSPASCGPVSLSYSQNGMPVSAPTNAGSYAVQAGLGDSSCQITSGATGTLVIAPASLGITANNKSMTYGGTVPSFDAAYSGLVNGDASSVVSGQTCGAMDGSGAPVTSATPVGTYTITCSGGSASNYTISYHTGTLSIAPAALTIAANNQTMLLHGPAPAFTASYSGLVNGDNSGVVSGLTCAATDSSGAPVGGSTPVGQYPIRCSGASAANYTISYVQGTLSVTYAPNGICDGDAGHAILQPINADGSSVFKAGSTVAARFRVCDASGVSIGAAGVVTSFLLVKTSADPNAAIDESVSSTTPDTAFRWDATNQQWVFNMSTKGLASATKYYYEITLNDGSTIDFSFALK